MERYEILARKAERAAESGETSQARELSRESVSAAAEAHGERTYPHAVAMNRAGWVHSQIGEHDEARSLLMEALDAASDVSDEAWAQARLDFGLNLGVAMMRAGDFVSAERRLHLNATARRDALGPHHPDYAHALQMLAEAQYGNNKLGNAAESAAEAVGIFEKVKHPAVAEAVALEAEIVTHGGEALGAPFAELSDLDDSTIERIAAASIERCRKCDARLALPVLEALHRLLLERLGESHGASIRVLAGIVNTHRELGQLPQRRRALDQLVAAFECLGAIAEEVAALMARALAEFEADDHEAALRTHAEAISRAVEASDARLEAKARRFLGLLLLDVGRVDEATDSLRAAHECASRARDADQLSRADAALGVGLARAGDAEGAKKHLDAALITLPIDDPDVEWVETRLEAAHGRPEALAEAPEYLAAHERLRRLR